MESSDSPDSLDWAVILSSFCSRRIGRRRSARRRTGLRADGRPEVFGADD
jgi:hypothetical protein